MQTKFRLELLRIDFKKIPEVYFRIIIIIILHMSAHVSEWCATNLPTYIYSNLIPAKWYQINIPLNIYGNETWKCIIFVFATIQMMLIRDAISSK